MYEHHESIGAVEASYMMRTNRGDIRVLDEKYINKAFEGYGYDFKFCHPTILACKNLVIPTRAGEEHTLTKLPEIGKIGVGYYVVKISCENKKFRKLFTFSKHHVYTDRSLYHAMKHQKEFGVKINLVHNEKPNAYLYNPKCLTTGLKIFGNWFKKLSKLRELFPKNGLLKHIGSSLSGELAKRNTITKTEKEIRDEKLSVGVDDTCDYQIVDEKNYDAVRRMELWSNEKPFKHNIRFKPFLMAFMRNKVARVAYQHLDNVVRIYADAVIFNKPFDFKEKDFIPEAKSTGVMMYRNAKCGTKDLDKFYAHLKEHDDDFFKAIQSRINSNY
jgi:hypothetical protein